MKSTALKVVVLVIAGLALASCRMAPLYNVESKAMPSSSTATLEDVTEAIKSAAVGLGWQIKELAPDEIEAKKVVRNKHTAIISITYDTKKFSIFYKDSIELGYDRSGKGQIKNHYNLWVQDLEEAIVAHASVI